MGADHTLGTGRVDSEDSYVKSSIYMMKYIAGVDNIFCMFAGIPMMMDKEITNEFFNVLSTYFGEPWDMARLLKLGNDTISFEIKFNEAAKIGDAVMPKMFTEEKSEVTGAVYDVTPEQASQIQAALQGNDNL